MSNSVPTEKKEISVAIVEDDNDFRDNLAALINTAAGFRCVGAYRSGELALAELPQVRPQVVVMDINLPQMSGIECVRRLLRLVPALQVLMLTVYDQEDDIFEALKAGAMGYLLKSTPVPEILQAIVDVHRGGGPMSSNIARKVIASFRRRDSTARDIDSLTGRESEILEYLAEGYTYKEIGERLDVTYETVHTHIGRIYHKLQVRSRGEAVAAYFGWDRHRP